jgi:hypothetical protein
VRAIDCVVVCMGGWYLERWGWLEVRVSGKLKRLEKDSLMKIDETYHKLH